jgi:hypothetical protein
MTVQAKSGFMMQNVPFRNLTDISHWGARAMHAFAGYSIFIVIIIIIKLRVVFAGRVQLFGRILASSVTSGQQNECRM